MSAQGRPVIDATCHCGGVKVRVSRRPETLTACNCSVCRRIGALWAYCRPDEVEFVAGAGTTVAYVQGDRTLELHHCPTCGCITHWESVDKHADRMAVNARLMDPVEIEGVPVRRFDGASTWTFLD